MRIRRKTISVIALASLFVLLSVFCGKKSDKDIILDMMKEVGKYVEDKDTENLSRFISEDYIDFQGRNKSQTEAMINQYFQDFHGIVSHVLSTHIEDVTPEEASIQTDVLVSSGGAKLFRKFVKYAGDYYRIKVRLVKREDRWQLKYAEWAHIQLEDLFPDSMSILKKIFPKI